MQLSQKILIGIITLSMDAGECNAELSAFPSSTRALKAQIRANLEFTQNNFGFVTSLRFTEDIFRH